MTNYLRIDGEDELYNMDYIRKMWKADEPTEDSETGLAVIYMELDTATKLHIKFENRLKRDSTFDELLTKVSVVEITTKAEESFSIV
ncbi:hypothetical protein [Arundinibacter roseus]|uniref:Uncharacterized protein n=1 Tax=Arundinibacter roseus TaxID=2070510 RepID=A0A4R4JZS9_9BACT|nr:hypothetical protein [Arundinibacter roseus]TDB60398.1 hypothetical protein EZE20_20925 [Arundinibacter roseus]